MGKRNRHEHREKIGPDKHRAWWLEAVAPPRDGRASFGTIKARMGATHLAAAYDPWKEATAPKTVDQFTSIIAAAEA
jgi:hypothetical protein